MAGKVNIISTAVVLNESKNSRTRVSIIESNGRIIGKEYDSATAVGFSKVFSSIEEAKAWVHEIAPGGEFKPVKGLSKDHYDNVGSNRKSFEEMWGIHHESDEIVQTLNGSETYFKRVVGYCAYHKKYITSTQAKTKQCLQKGCARLIMIEGPFWMQRDQKVTAKKISKAMEQV